MIGLPSDAPPRGLRSVCVGLCRADREPDVAHPGPPVRETVDPIRVGPTPPDRTAHRRARGSRREALSRVTHRNDDPEARGPRDTRNNFNGGPRIALRRSGVVVFVSSDPTRTRATSASEPHRASRPEAAGRLLSRRFRTRRRGRSDGPELAALVFPGEPGGREEWPASLRTLVGCRPLKTGPKPGKNPPKRAHFGRFLAGFQPLPGRHDRLHPVPGGHANAQVGFFSESFKEPTDQDLRRESARGPA